MGTYGLCFERADRRVVLFSYARLIAPELRRLTGREWVEAANEVLRMASMNCGWNSQHGIFMAASIA